MLKIHIIGGPGSGKTTLAQQLAARFHIPHHDLDLLGLKNGNRKEAYIEDAFAIAEQPAWITEGIFLFWTDPLLHQADCIVLLDVSWPLAAWRIVRRHIIKSLRGTNPYRGTKMLINFLKDTRSYYLEKDTSKLSIPESIQRYLEEYRAYTDAPTAELLLMNLNKYEFNMLLPGAGFTNLYLEKYKEKVFIVKGKADRERLIEMLAQN